MCGLSGYVGVHERALREDLGLALGWGIDTRGGDAIGYVVINGKKMHGHKYLGRWSQQNSRHITRAFDGSILMQHARFATHGANTLNNAHPFRLARPEREIIGMHNGIAWDMQESAKKHKRVFSVDSRELYECLLDNEPIGMGYGVLTWIERHQGVLDPAIFLARASSDGQIEVAKLKGDRGYVYGSTVTIVKDACDIADVKIESWYDIAVGKVHRLTDTGVYVTSREPIEFEDVYKKYDLMPYSTKMAWEQEEELSQAERDWVRWEKQWQAKRAGTTDDKRAAWDAAAHDLDNATDDDSQEDVCDPFHLRVGS